MSHFVYLIECSDKSIYTGYTTNINRRLLEHQSGGLKAAKYIRAKGFKKFLYSEQFSTKSDAMKREYQIKQLPREMKLSLFNKW